MMYKDGSRGGAEARRDFAEVRGISFVTTHPYEVGDMLAYTYYRELRFWERVRSFDWFGTKKRLVTERFEVTGIFEGRVQARSLGEV